ncbi:hypothetical protein [Geomonas anaerohicana]|uniref:Uncharacterized protein n=1 Tax=Geomonas anaerohicana TaxID=2798583 RepID=A0ABS0YJS2_9BACT|nr:hypothetical protein [Geomonas anaerohicana]MBJ6752618.1 hypothetical protein [Geomonas anaerohicana]
MTSHQEKRSGREQSSLLRVASVVLAAASTVMLAQPVMAADYTITGSSNTYLRMTRTINKEDLYPLYEYLRFSVTAAEKDGSATSLHLGAWGRVDLVDKSSDHYTDGDLQYGYLSYQAAKNNLVINAGRQFITEGVAADRVDGLYVRSDFAAGITAAAFAGSPVVTTPNYKGGDFIYGARVAQGKPGLYSVGVSALRNESDNARDREEEGLDLWIHPVKQVDLTGRSSYNSITDGWMEHAYTLSVAPIDAVTVSADFSRINYQDYFYNVTTNAFALAGNGGLLDPREKVTAAGVSAAWTPVKNLTVAAEYKNYGYEILGSADYVGGKVAYTTADALSLGASGHRMDGSTDRTRYYDYRLYALKKTGHTELGVDFYNVIFDRPIDGVKSSYALTGIAGYEFTEKLNVGGEIEYSQSPDFNREWRALVKVAYAFETKGGEKGGKSEK